MTKKDLEEKLAKVINSIQQRTDAIRKGRQEVLSMENDIKVISSQIDQNAGAISILREQEVGLKMELEELKKTKEEETKQPVESPVTQQENQYKGKMTPQAQPEKPNL